MKYLYCFILLQFFTVGIYAQEKEQNPVRIKANQAEGAIIDGMKADILRGQVEILYEHVILHCDSAYNFKQENKVKAFGHVDIRQGDSIHIMGDSLYYSPDDDLALLQGHVTLQREEMTLRTPFLTYYPDKKWGFYTNGGLLEQADVRLQSVFGYYQESGHLARFKDRIFIEGSDFFLWADTLDYDLGKNRVHFYGPTVIESKESRIYCERGYYDLKEKNGKFYQSARMLDRGRRIKADTLTYHQKDGKGNAIGQVYFHDTAEGITLFSGRAEYNNSRNRVLASSNPIILIHIDKDTLYVRADTLLSEGDSNGRELFAFPNVRMLRDNFSAISSEMHFSGRDSLLQLTGKPVAWIDSFQLSGDSIVLAFQQNKPYRLRVSPHALLASRESKGIYNQTTGRSMEGYFKQDTLRSMHFTGNAETIYFAKDDSGRFIGINRLTCSTIHLRFAKGALQYIRFLNLPDGRFIPIQKANISEMILEGFIWKGAEKVTFETDFNIRPVPFEDIKRPLWSREAEDPLPIISPQN